MTASLEPNRKVTYKSPFTSPKEVYNAWKSGRISKTQALEIDQKQFGLGLWTVPGELLLGGLEWQPQRMSRTQAEPSPYE